MNNTEMDCGYCRENLDDYIEGRLNGADLIAFENHLQSCDECTQLLMVHRISEKVIVHERSISPDFYLTERIMSRLRNNESDGALIRVLRPALTVVSVAAAIFTGVLISNIPGNYPRNMVPVELSMMNDTDIEAIDVLSAE